MVKSSHKSSFCGLMGLVPAWAQVAVIVLIAASLFLAGAKLNGKRWAAKVAADDRARQTQVIQAQSDAIGKTAENAVQTAQIDVKNLKELQDANQIINGLRARIDALRVREQAARRVDHATSGSGTGVGDGSQSDGARDSAEARTLCLDLGADALTAVKQRDALREKVSVDAQTINQTDGVKP